MTFEHSILTKYFPDGTPYMFGGSVPSIQERLFSGKELDIAHGYECYDFGARHYNPLVYRFTTMDPMAEKYYSISPYAFCANNPMRYTDPDGMKLIITSANGYTLEYSAGMQYKGNDSAVKEQVGVLNQMNGVENGQKVLSTLINSDKTYNITNGRSANGTAGTIENNNGATIRMNNENDFISVSHELFHCYQYDNGQGGASIFNEVEAYLYSTTLSMSVFGGSGSRFYMGIPSSAESADFEEVVNKLQYGISFSLDDFNKTVSLFQNNSSVNATGVYNNYPLKGNKESKSLISQFYPLIPF